MSTSDGGTSFSTPPRKESAGSTRGATTPYRTRLAARMRDPEQRRQPTSVERRSRSSQSSPESQINKRLRPTLLSPGPSYTDRFIPTRVGDRGADLDRRQAAEHLHASAREDGSAAYITLLKRELLGVDNENSASHVHRKRIFQYSLGNVDNPHGGGTAPSPYIRNPLEKGTLASAVNEMHSPLGPHRRVMKGPHRILDAPDLKDDFYMNLMDWSSTNVLAIGLGTVVYLWSASSGKVTRLHDLASENDDICSVAWSRSGTYLSVGTRRGTVQVWDASHCTRLRVLNGHWGRVGVVRWGPHIMASGSRDCTIRLADVRVGDALIRELRGHRAEVCGLEWSHDSRMLASGGNDNIVNIWDPESGKSTWSINDHTAAVKALAWSPHNTGQIATGGGLRDGTIRIWNTAAATNLHVRDAGAQVCGLHWSKNVNEIVSTHGYNTNAIKLWKLPQMECFATIPGHSMRIVYMSTSPCGRSIVTGAGDETVRFFHLFPGPPAIVDQPLSPRARAQIR